MAFDLSRCSKLRLLALAVAYGQITKREYVNLRRHQLSAIEFNKPTPSIAPEIIERLNNALAQPISHGPKDAYLSPETTANQLNKTISQQKNQSSDYGAWDDSYRREIERKKISKEKKVRLVQQASIVIALVVVATAGLKGYQWYSEYEHKKIYEIPVQQLQIYQRDVLNETDPDISLHILLQASRKLLSDQRMINENTMPILLSILQSQPTNVRALYGLTTTFVELQLSLDQKKQLLSNQNGSIREVELLNELQQELLQIKLDTFSNQ